MHPETQKLSYVIFQTALSYLNQIGTIDRDPAPAKNALATFQRFLKLYPDAKDMENIKENIKKCNKNIVGHEFYVGKFYLKTKKYKAALARFEEIKEKYPKTNFEKKAIEYIAITKEKIKIQKK